MTAMTKYLAGILTVIAFGVTVIAYSLVFPHLTPLDAREAGMVSLPGTAQAQYAYPAGRASAEVAPASLYPATVTPMAVAQPVLSVPVRTVEEVPAPRRVVTRTVEHAPRRDWKKTALVIGGSTAAGAGIGGIFGGKKGALIGAALGGGTGTLVQTLR